MICTEVGELMQRQLDYDLDEHELTLLMTHLGNCKACQALFERLTLLSGSLEQLPRVTPSISIVDSILPELDAIDRQRAGHRAKNSYWKRWMTATASVAAAAAVVFVMTNLTGQDNQANDSVPQLAILEKHSSTTSEHDQRLRMEITADGANDESLERLSDPEPLSGSLHIEPLSSPIEGLHESRKHQNNQSSDNKITDREAGVLDYAPTPTSATEQQMGSESTEPLQIAQNSNVQQAPPSTEQQSLHNEGEEIVVTNQYGSLEGESGKKEDQDYGIASHIFEKEKYSSPNGDVYITIEPHIIVLYETSTEQEIRNWELDGSGTVHFVEWSADGNAFSYEQINETGEGSIHSVSINN